MGLLEFLHDYGNTAFMKEERNILLQIFSINLDWKNIYGSDELAGKAANHEHTGNLFLRKMIVYVIDRFVC